MFSTLAVPGLSRICNYLVIKFSNSTLQDLPRCTLETLVGNYSSWLTFSSLFFSNYGNYFMHITALDLNSMKRAHIQSAFTAFKPLPPPLPLSLTDLYTWLYEYCTHTSSSPTADVTDSHLRFQRSCQSLKIINQLTISTLDWNKKKNYN